MAKQKQPQQIPKTLIEITAFQIYQKRVRREIAGNSETDWQQALEYLQKQKWRVRWWNFQRNSVVRGISRFVTAPFRLGWRMSQKKSDQESQADTTEVVKKGYGENFQAHLLEEYKMYVEMTDRVTQRRGQANTFYISLLSGLLVVFSFLIKTKLSKIESVLVFTLASLGLFLCIVWFVNINSYKQLNYLKFKIIHEIEQYLPFPCYDREWKILEQDRKIKYRRLSKVESYVPLIIGIPYFVLFLYSLLELLFNKN